MDSSSFFSPSSAVRLLSFLEKQSQCSDSIHDGEESGRNNTNNDAIPITRLERIIRTHPIWFLPEKNRLEGERMLRGKEEGTFVIRKSSKRRTLALSLRQGPIVEHYLIYQLQDSKRLKLEISERSFDNILSLVYHYITVKEDFPILLRLPHLLMETTSRSNLASMALLGKDFWNYPMSFPPLQSVSPLMMEGRSKSETCSDVTLPQLLDDALNGLQDITDLLQYSLMDSRVSGRVHHRNKTPIIVLPNRVSSEIPSTVASPISSTYNRSSITDKISDYEDIWNDTELTSSQSEKRFKRYLNRKLRITSKRPMSSASTATTITNGNRRDEETDSSSCFRSLVSSEVFTSSSFVSSSTCSKDILDICLTDCDDDEEIRAGDSRENASKDNEDHLYSDPLDALERAIDTEIYDSIDPDSSTISSSTPDKFLSEETSTIGSLKNLTFKPKTIHKSASAEDLTEPFKIPPRETRKISCGPVMQPGRKRSLPKLVQETRRFSLVINRYIQRTSSHKEFSSSHEGQVDSSSWEFLYQESPSEEPESFNTSSSCETSSNACTEKIVEGWDSSLKEIESVKDESFASHKIQSYIRSLYQDEKSTFGILVRQFLICTSESKEEDPRTVFGNVRQFITGIRNYLVGSGEGNLKNIIQSEREKLKPNKCMNLNTIYEEVLYELILKPLQTRLVLLLGNRILDEKKLQTDELKIHKRTYQYFLRIQSEFSPIKKIAYLFKALQFVQKMLKGNKDGDETLDTRLRSYVSQFLNRYDCKEWFTSQMEYTLYLLPQYCLGGESKRYLTLVSSAVAFRPRVKTSLFRQSRIFGHFETKWKALRRRSEKDSKESFERLTTTVTLLIPNESDGTLLREKLELKKNVSKTDLIKMIQDEKHHTDSQEFDLSFLSDDGEQTLNVFYEFNEELFLQGKTVLVYRRKNTSFLLPALSRLLSYYESSTTTKN